MPIASSAWAIQQDRAEWSADGAVQRPLLWVLDAPPDEAQSAVHRDGRCASVLDKHGRVLRRGQLRPPHDGACGEAAVPHGCARALLQFPHAVVGRAEEPERLNERSGLGEIAARGRMIEGPPAPLY